MNGYLASGAHRVALIVGLLLVVALVAVVILTRRFTAPAPTVVAVAGRVLSKGQPVAGARVGLKGSQHRVLTDADGRFVVCHASFRTTPAPWRLTAAADGFFIAGVDATGDDEALIELRPLPAADNPDYAWIDPRPGAARPEAEGEEACATCHRVTYDEWAHSAHGRGHANRRFMNLYDGTDWHGNEDIGWSLRREFPEGAGVCASCHAPSAPLTPDAIGDLSKLGGVARLGVHCDLCHKIVAVDVSHVGHDHGRFAMRLLRPPPDQRMFFGTLDDDDRGHSAYAPLYGQSRYCAPCHEGIVFGKHQYSDYSEWLASPYAKQGVECQQCHMKPTGRMTNVAPGHEGIERDPQTLASHRSTAGTLDALRACLELSLSARRKGEQIEATVEVRTRGIGHRFPAGHSARQLILWLDARGDLGHYLPLESGPTLPPLAGEGDCFEGGLAGRPGRLFAKVFQAADERQPIADWEPGELAYDSRLPGDGVERTAFSFKFLDRTASLTARLIYRRFPKAIADAKRWPDNDVLVAEVVWEKKP